MNKFIRFKNDIFNKELVENVYAFNFHNDPKLKEEDKQYHTKYGIFYKLKDNTGHPNDHDIITFCDTDEEVDEILEKILNELNS